MTHLLTLTNPFPRIIPISFFTLEATEFTMLKTFQTMLDVTSWKGGPQITLVAINSSPPGRYITILNIWLWMIIFESISYAFFSVKFSWEGNLESASGNYLVTLANKALSTNTWWRHQMEASSALLAICAGNSPVPGEFPAQRPVTRSFGVFFDLNKRLSKHS